MRTIVILIFCLVISGCLFGQPAPKPMRVSPVGVTIAGIEVGGMTHAELKHALLEVAKRQNTLPENASFGLQGEVIGEKAGLALDIEATADAVLSSAPHSEVKPVFQQVNPPLTQEILKTAKIIGSYETPIMDDHPDRLQNINLTISLINNTLLTPGQEFSFNALTGEPTQERGFRRAVIIEYGKKVEGIGGGMCQVSTTLYNAALEAGLNVTERHPHSQPVSYAPEGRDATTYTNKDLRFINSTRQAIILRLFVDNRAVKADIRALPK